MNLDKGGRPPTSRPPGYRGKHGSCPVTMLLIPFYLVRFYLRRLVK